MRDVTLENAAHATRPGIAAATSLARMAASLPLSADAVEVASSHETMPTEIIVRAELLAKGQTLGRRSTRAEPVALPTKMAIPTTAKKESAIYMFAASSSACYPLILPSMALSRCQAVVRTRRPPDDTGDRKTALRWTKAWRFWGCSVQTSRNDTRPDRLVQGEPSLRVCCPPKPGPHCFEAYQGFCSYIVRGESAVEELDCLFQISQQGSRDKHILNSRTVGNSSQSMRVAS